MNDQELKARDAERTASRPFDWDRAMGIIPESVKAKYQALLLTVVAHKGAKQPDPDEPNENPKES